MRIPVNRRARELRSPGTGGEGVQQIRFFSYRLVPGALPGMTAEPGWVGRRETGTASPSGRLILQIVNIVALNLNKSKLYNTRRCISGWWAVTWLSPVPRSGP